MKKIIEYESCHKLVQRKKQTPLKYITLETLSQTKHELKDAFSTLLKSLTP